MPLNDELSQGIDVLTATAPPSGNLAQSYDTPLSAAEESAFQEWKKLHAPNDSGADYDLRGAFKAGLTPAENGHWPDTFKKPNHPTFSDESIYAAQRPDIAGHWNGEQYAGVKLMPVDHDPFVTAAPSSGNILDPASQPVSPLADSPLAKVGRLIGERGLAGAMPPRTIGAPSESMHDFWRRWPEMIAKLTGKSAMAPVSSEQNNSYKLVPVDHDPFTGAP